MICTLHRPAARPGRSHSFANRDDYAKHVEGTHFGLSTLPAFLQQRLGIEDGDTLPDGNRRELWTG